MKANHWHQLAPELWILRDSCNVYAVQGPAGAVLVHAGTERVAEYLAELELRGPITLLLTHSFRDHCDGAIRLHNAGVRVLANYWDKEFYTDPEQRFRERATWVSYENLWNHFGPVRAVPVDDWLMDYGKYSIGGLEWEVIPMPAHTLGASSYLVTLNGQRVAFVGETVCGHGRTGRLAPLQYNYNDLRGALNLWYACEHLSKAKPDTLLPSMGEPVHDVTPAIRALQDNLRELAIIQPNFSDGFIAHDEDDLQEILPRLFLSKYSVANTHFIVSESGEVLALDFGYNEVNLRAAPSIAHTSSRRPTLHGLSGLKKRFGSERIDTVLVSHYHDDHVCGIPILQRLFDTKLWAAELFADLLEYPERYDRPCLWPEAMPVARRLPCEQTFEWEGINFTLFPMSGHTRFSTLVCFELDGVRIAHTGDQIFFHDAPHCDAPSNLFVSGAKLFTNHVYKNGLDLGCYHETLEYLRAFKPDLILSGHAPAYRTSPEWWQALEEGAQEFDRLHQSLMILGNDEIHFGADSQGGVVMPYRAHSPNGEAIYFTGWIMNPYPTNQKATVQLVTPEGWQSSSQQLQLAPRKKREFAMTLTPAPDAICRRQPIGLQLVVGGRSFGLVAEALVTVRQTRF